MHSAAETQLQLCKSIFDTSTKKVAMQSDLREPTDPSAPNQPATTEKLDQLISEVARLRKSVKKLTEAETATEAAPFNDPEFLNVGRRTPERWRWIRRSASRCLNVRNALHPSDRYILSRHIWNRDRFALALLVTCSGAASAAILLYNFVTLAIRPYAKSHISL